MNYGRHNRVYIDRPPRVGTAESSFTIPQNLGMRQDVTRNQIFPYFSTQKINEDLLSDKNIDKLESEGIYTDKDNAVNEPLATKMNAEEATEAIPEKQLSIPGAMNSSVLTMNPSRINLQ